MKILAIGDVVGSSGVAHLEEALWKFRGQVGADFVVVNGENASDVHGLSSKDAEKILAAGADVITLGNHSFGHADLFPLLDSEKPILRPANYPPEAPGRGYDIFRADGWRILCVNLGGRFHMDPLADPFDAAEKILEREKGNYDISLMDFHAEATSEKIAMGYCFDGKFAVLFGTHTHVPTADTKILPGGTGYVTDLGMCGPEESVIGCEIEPTIRRLRTLVPVRFHAATGPSLADGVLFTVDEEKNRCVKVERVKF
ncbi:MAG: YmdB family metallophosphoesterase [Clostridia bacterium]|nr:YmdB family metallophosphoesterase [Clostridia bacterium]